MILTCSTFANGAPSPREARHDSIVLDIGDVVVGDRRGAVREDTDVLQHARVGPIGFRADQVAGDDGLSGGSCDRGIDLDLIRVHVVAEAVDREVFEWSPRRP